jgi:hypothetical protein
LLVPLFSAGIFTDGQDIQSIPWELQSFDLNRPCEGTNEGTLDAPALIRSREDHRFPNFPLHSAIDEVVEVIWALDHLEQGQGVDVEGDDIVGVYVAPGSHRATCYHCPSEESLARWRPQKGTGEALILLGDTLRRVVHGSAGAGRGAATPFLQVRIVLCNFINLSV